MLFAALSRLVGADACRVVDDLPLEIVEADAVVVDDADLPDTGGGEIEQERRAEAAGADHQHLGVLQPLLSFAADLLQHQLALVALDLVRGEHEPISMPSAQALPVAPLSCPRRRHPVPTGLQSCAACFPSPLEGEG